MFCRLCLKSDKETNLFSLVNNSILCDYIFLCLSIKDNISKHICCECQDKVYDWVKFKNECEKVQEILKKTEFDQKTTSPEINPVENDNCDAIFESTVNDLYICEICKKEFDNCEDYINHQEDHNGQEVFKCELCVKIFSSRNSLLLHEQNHKILCPICGKMLQKSSMRLHQNMHSNKFQCRICETKCNSQAMLNQHNLTKHANKRDFICDICGKDFSSKTSLHVHQQSHSEKRLYMCKHCDYAGKTRSALFTHMATHSTGTYCCQICSKIFKSKRNLNDHLKRSHVSEKNYSCEYCSKKFAVNYMLQTHLRIHTRDRPYICKICDKSFMRSDTLKHHMIVHNK